MDALTALHSFGQGANRAAASTVTVPVDALAWLLRKGGVPVGDEPVGGSKWMGRLGLIEESEDGAAGLAGEIVGGLGPMVVAARAPQAAAALGELAEVLPRLSSGGRSVVAAQRGAISKDGKERLLRDLQAGTPSGKFTLGDVTAGQASQLDRLMGSAGTGVDVQMTDKALRHLVERRVAGDGFTPAEVAEIAAKAMERRAAAFADPAAAHQGAALVNRGVKDAPGGRPYDATMALRPAEGGYEVVTVIPKGKRGRK